MDPQTWPFLCTACQVTIPNPLSWSAHEQGKKHTVKSVEYHRRQEEQGRTVHVSGPVTTTPVAELLLRNYFEESFGIVEKVITQPKYCFVIFESTDIARDCVKEKRQEFGGYIIAVKPRCITESAGGDHDAALRRKLNACRTFTDQLAFVDKSFTSPTEVFKKGIDDLFAAVTNKMKGNYELSFELIGSVRCNLLMAGSDVDISLQVDGTGADVNSFGELAMLKALGEKTVRSPGHPSRVNRDITDTLYVITGTLMRIAHDHTLQSIHAVPGARKPVIRFLLQGKRVEVSLNNTAALINSRFVELLVRDHIFLHLLKFTRFVFSKLEVTRIGRFSSYSVVLALVAYLVENGVLPSLERLVSSVPADNKLVDAFCQQQWDYRLPDEIPFDWKCNSKQAAISAITDHFVRFCAWLTSLEGVLDVRSGKVLLEDAFYQKYDLPKVIFKSGAINVVDPFEIEHNTTSQITPRSAFQVQKILKSVQIKAKIKRLLDFVSDIDRVANTEKDWGIAIFLPVDQGQAGTTLSAPAKKEQQNVVSIGKNQFQNFCVFLREVLRIEIENFEFDDDAEGMVISPKKAKSDVPNNNSPVIDEMPLKLDCSTSKRLWTGRRTIRRKIDREYKGCSPVDIENQVTRIMLSDGQEDNTLPSPLPFTITATDSGRQLLHFATSDVQSQPFQELVRFVTQSGQKYFS